MKQPFSYYGGKQKMTKHIIPLLPKHRIYVEPFCGGASVFWLKPRMEHRDHIEVLNDLNEDIIITYRCLKNEDYFDLLVKRLEGTLYSKAEHQKAQKLLQNKCTGKVDRAWAFIVCQQMSFAKDGYNAGWAYTRAKDVGTTISWQNKLKEYTEQYTERLKYVHLDCDDAIKVIKRWDDPETLFYIDPPYPGTNQGNYQHKYNQDDFENLIEVLKEVKGSFVLSCFPNKDVPNEWESVEFNLSKNAGANKINVAQKRKIEKVWIVDKNKTS